MKTFEELGVVAPIRKAILEMGFVAPMPIQEQTIPYLIDNPNDLIALAQTGTGKTAAYGIPIIEHIEVSQHKPQALILCPTRELCLQIADDITNYSKYIPEIKALPVYGGSSIESQIRTLKKGVQIVVATPGRLLDLIRRRTIALNEIKTVVLDEADEMLNMGFEEDIRSILNEINDNRILWMFSATMPKEIRSIVGKYMTNPHEIVVGSKNQMNENIQHKYFMVRAKDKYLALKRIADYYPNIYGIIFCRTRRETQEIADKLIQDGYNAEALHGELSQAQRDYVMQKFRVKNIQLLVATDVAARGLDVDNLTHVIHFGLPDDVESYTHRSGRTARAGKTGLSIAICHMREKGKLRAIEKLLKKKFEKGTMPTGTQICEKQLFNFVDRLEKVNVELENIDEYLPSIYRKLEWLEKEDIIKRIVALEFNRVIGYYRDAAELKEEEEYEDRPKKDRKSDSKNFSSKQGFTKLRINFGKRDKLFPNKLIELINQVLPTRVQIGKIDLFDRYAIFEIDSKQAQMAAEMMSMYTIDDRDIEVSLVEGNRRGKSSSSPKRRRNKSNKPNNYR